MFNTAQFNAFVFDGPAFRGATPPPPPPPAADFWAALAAYVGPALAASLPGGFASCRTPPGSVLPYGRYVRMGGSLTRNAAGEALRDCEFAATFYADSPAAADALADLYDAAIKDAPLAFAAGTLVYLRSSRVDDAEVDPDPGPALEDVYSSRVTARYLIQEMT